MKTISVVIPVYNEAPVLHSSLSHIMQIVDQTLTADQALSHYTFEFVVVDDGSCDETAQVLAQMAKQESRLRTLRFTRNFDKEAAILAGLKHARGDAVVLIDSDLQHPPSLIVPMIKLWQSGLMVVHAVKTRQQAESWLQKKQADFFYAIFKIMSGLDLRGHSDFKLLDRQVVDMLLDLPERQRFFRGLISWANFPSGQLPFEVSPRPDGSQSKWNWLKLLNYAISNITIFSSLPLKLVTCVGVATLLFGGVIGVISLAQKLDGKAIDGFTTVNLLIIVIGGAVLLSLGVIGHYLARLYDEIKGRPAYLLRDERDKDA